MFAAYDYDLRPRIYAVDTQKCQTICRRIRRQSPFSATVAVFGDSVDRSYSLSTLATIVAKATICRQKR